MRAQITLPAAATADADSLVPTVIMAGACVNALVVRIVEGLADGTPAALGISPFQIVALFVAARLCIAGGTVVRPRWALAVDAFALVLILFPSSAVSWAALALYAGIQAATTRGKRRLGSLMFLALALAALWSSVVLKWIAVPVTTAEAFVVGKMLALVRADVVQIANVVGNPDTHSLILMTRCTTADALPMAIVSLVGVALLLGAPSRVGLWRSSAMLAALLLAANLVRLSAMAWSAEAYAVVHGPIGANIFDGLQAATVLALGNRAART